jgi:predicted permease
LSVLLGVSVVRLAVLPALTLGLVLWLRTVGLLPADPLVALVLLVQAAMPSAQNLVLLMQLQPATRPLAPKMAGMLLRQYVLAMFSVTGWFSVFIAVLL